MKEKNVFVLFSLMMMLLISLSVSADYEAVSSPVIGSWMLDRVYENASSADKFALDAENAASVYGEQDNIYAFFPDYLAEMTMEGMETCGYWEKTDAGFRMVVNSSCGAPEKGAAPDINPFYEMEFSYDAEQNALHRYWKEEDPDAFYHDLDFVYKKIPQGTWQMTEVYSREPGSDPVLMDPDTSQSLYAESINATEISGTSVLEIVPSVDGYINETGTMIRIGDSWLLKYDNGYETMMEYDDKTGNLHRYWMIEAADAPAIDLDFVYEMVPLGNWRLKYVYELNAEGEPMQLDPEQETELYQDSAVLWQFSPLSKGAAAVSGENYDGYEWELQDGAVLVDFDDGREAVFVYDGLTDVLYRYETAGERTLYFVYLKN